MTMFTAPFEGVPSEVESEIKTAFGSSDSIINVETWRGRRDEAVESVVYVSSDVAGTELVSAYEMLCESDEIDEVELGTEKYWENGEQVAVTLRY